MSILVGDFLRATREMRASERGQLHNQATKQNYFFYDRMVMANGARFGGGSKLKTNIQLRAGVSGGIYDPQSEFTVTDNDTLTPIEVNWAHLHGSYVLVDEQVMLNKGNVEAFTDLVRSKESAMMTKLLNDFEENLWASPNSATMESAASTQYPYSILAFVTRDGQVPSSTNGGVTGSNWTTIQTVANTETAFRNKTGTYSAADPLDLQDGLIASFDEMRESVKFETPDPLKSYTDDASRRNQCIVTAKDGIVTFKAALRAVNDRMSNLSDPSIVGPQYEGIPLKYVSELDGQGWTAGQPDYLWLDLGVLHPFFASDHYMKEKVIDGDSKNPNKTAVFNFTSYNVICYERRKLGRVYAA